jgi:MFS family permease
LTVHRHEHVYRAYVLRFIDGLVTSTLAFALPLMIYNATHSVTWSGIAFLIEWLPRMISVPIAGPMVDRFGSKRMFIIADGLRAFVLVAAFATSMLLPNVWQLLLLITVATGMLAQVSFVAAEHLSVHVVTSKPVHEVQSMQVNIDQAVLVLGPMVGGALLMTGNWLVFASCAFFSVFGLNVATRLRGIKKSHGQEGGTTHSTLQGLRHGLRAVWSNESLRYVVFGTIIFNFLLALITVLTPAIVKQHFGGDDAQVSALWSIGALLSVIAVTAASRVVERFGVLTIGIFSGVVASVAAVLAGFADAYASYVLFAALFLAMDGAYAVYIRTARARLVPLEEFGVTVGAIVLLSMVPFPLVGLLVAVMPFSLAPVCLAVCASLCVITTLLSHHKIDRQTLAEA